MKRYLGWLGSGALAIALVVGVSPGVSSTVAKGANTSQVAMAHAAFVKYMSSHAPAVLHGTATLSHVTNNSNNAPTGLESYNWSGFADAESSANRTFNDVSGTWTIPRVSCPSYPYENQDAFLAQWVGLDGLTDGTVEQLGTATQCFDGAEYYYVWYEMYPNGTIEEGTNACINDNVDCPRPGDQVSASVNVTPGTGGEDNYTLSLTDYSQPQQSFSVSQQCASNTCANSSAEWVVERPAFELPFGAQILPLADFGATQFESATQSSGGPASGISNVNGTVYNLAMIDDSASYFLACVGQRAQSGSSLQTSSASACPAVAPGYNGSFSTSWDSSF